MKTNHSYFLVRADEDLFQKWKKKFSLQNNSPASVLEKVGKDVFCTAQSIGSKNHSKWHDVAGNTIFSSLEELAKQIKPKELEQNEVFFVLRLNVAAEFIYSSISQSVKRMRNSILLMASSSDNKSNAIADLYSAIDQYICVKTVRMQSRSSGLFMSVSSGKLSQQLSEMDLGLSDSEEEEANDSRRIGCYEFAITEYGLCNALEDDVFKDF